MGRTEKKSLAKKRESHEGKGSCGFTEKERGRGARSQRGGGGGQESQGALHLTLSADGTFWKNMARSDD